ncbi:MAG: hypothetical protein HYZ81_03595 [Nitrospinae bacterium]|nr:hypothetical protein [Nitrospinota bacterium]
MSTIKLISEHAATGPVKEIYDEIKAFLGTSFVPANFKAAAHNVEHLDAYWRQYKAVMGSGQVDKAVKEIVAMVVSAMNTCGP